MPGLTESGKSTIINQVRQTVAHGHPIDMGIYVNADLIAADLAKGEFTFANYEISNITMQELIDYASVSGLFRSKFNEQTLRLAINLDNGVRLINIEQKEVVAQLLSNFLIGYLLQSEKKCSMETVFSHVSKVHFMQQAKSLGYKVYLYFVATEDPLINIARVQSRVAQGGHDVPEQKIRDRYIKSLSLMYDAAQEAYQAYFFDNSGAKGKHQQIAHFKLVGRKKKWDQYNADDLPEWFVKYYAEKQPLQHS